MSHKDVQRHKGQKHTYALIVLDYRPQKADPNQIRIMAGGNLIKYNDELSGQTADVTTAKLHWNSVISTENARYICLDLSLFYLTANLDYYEYIKMPLHLFPQWIIDQYDLNTHEVDGMVHIEMRKRYMGYRKQVSSPTSDCGVN
jgi:hypothetical protein